MGKEFGQLYKIFGITYYRASPHELKPFKGFFANGIGNWTRFAKRYFPPLALAFGFHYSIFVWGNEEYERVNRKNPDDYKDDQ